MHCRRFLRVSTQWNYFLFFSSFLELQLYVNPLRHGRFLYNDERINNDRVFARIMNLMESLQLTNTTRCRWIHLLPSKGRVIEKQIESVVLISHFLCTPMTYTWFIHSILITRLLWRDDALDQILKFCPIQEDSLITVMLFAFTDNLVQTFEFASKANKLTKEKWIRKK